MLRASTTIALFGGRFDPPHCGHTFLSRELTERAGFRKVWVIPSASPAYKPVIAAPEHRLALARLALQEHPLVEVRDLEMVRAQKTGQPSYTYDTLVELGAQAQTAATFAFILGTDQAAQLAHWHRFPEVLQLCHWVIVTRRIPGQDPEEGVRAALTPLLERGLIRPTPIADLGQMPVLGSWELASTQGRPGRTLALAETQAPSLSSTAIRAQIALTGKAPEGALLATVEDYLKRQRLYGS